MTLKEFVAANKKNVALVVAGLLLLAAAFLCGRFSVHTATITKTTDTKVDTLHKYTQADLDIAVSTAIQKNVDSQLKKVTTEVDQPNGTKTITTTVVKNTESQTQEKQVEVVHDVQIQYVDRVVTETKTEFKLVQPDLPKYHLSLMVGTDFGSLKLQSNAPYVNPLMLGLHFERRIAGPFFFGGYGMTDTSFQRKQAGLTLGFQW